MIRTFLFAAFIALSTQLSAENMDLKLSEITYGALLSGLLFFCAAIACAWLLIRGITERKSIASMDLYFGMPMLAIAFLALIFGILGSYCHFKLKKTEILTERKNELSKIYESAWDNYLRDSTDFSKKRADSLGRELLSIENRLK